ncbi:glycosyltransferase family 39 protein [Amycolatopsis sp. NPDC004368]
MPDTAEPDNRPVALVWRPLLAVVAVAGVVHLVVAARFGWHRDEFYYVISGRHLAWGYPDQPPLTPVLARLAAELPGGVLSLRVLAIVAQLGCVLLAAKLAAELGGRRRAQVLAAVATAVCPVFVAGSMLFGTTVTDQLVWAAVFVTVARALRLGSVMAWLVAGAVAGVGLENKDTVGVLLLGIVVGLVVFRRPVLRTPGPWLAGGLAALLLAPNVVWNAQHSWAQLRMAGVLADKQGGALGALPNVPLLLLVLAGPPLIVLWVFGVRWLCSAAGRDHRWVLVVAVTALVVFTAGGGKVYYSAPALLGLFAAGAVHAESRAAGSRWRWATALGLSGVFAVLIGLPVLPLRAEAVPASVNPQLVETAGWPEFVHQVTAAADTQPPGTTIFTGNYGEAGALTILGPAAGLRNPVSSAHNGYLLWGPPTGTPDSVLCVGEFGPDYLHRFWSDVRELAPISAPDGIANEETTHHAAIYECRRPRGSWAALWPGLSHLD